MPTLPDNVDVPAYKRTEPVAGLYVAGDSWLRKNRFGHWEMYVAGTPAERGSKIGVLSRELIAQQEDVFVARLREMIPSQFLARFLLAGVSVYNRNLGKHVPEEYKEEIYAVSRYASKNYESEIGDSYQRMMNYHAAHDIGHAVSLAGFVGCSTLGVANSKTPDGTLLIGRNFDFHINDEFAENKIVLFVNPSEGLKHAFVTWGGMIGAVSGMNERGLAVALNAAPSDIPFSSATPVSILAREILQYAGNIEEAVAIARRRRTFVSEQFIIGSAADNKMVSIEKTKNSMVVREAGNAPYIACTNHFLSDKLADKDKRKRNKRDERDESVSEYRMRRILQLADSIPLFTASAMETLLRDRRGIDGIALAPNDERSICLPVAHHGIIFHPASRTFMLSSLPFNDEPFVRYCLDDFLN
jgi:predicted choloylglycine hydrolase